MIYSIAILFFLSCISLVGAESACTPCNEPVDVIVKELQEHIKADSPLKKEDITYCHSLTIDGAYTLVRDGDICSVKLDDPEDCFKQKFDFKFVWLNFTCVLNMEVVKREIMDKQGSGLSKSATGLGVQATKGKRGLFDGKAGVPKVPEGGNLDGYWTELGVIGETKLCKKNAEKSEVAPFVLKDRLNFKNLQCGCSGDRIVQQMCQGPEAMAELKQSIGAAVQTVAADIVRTSIMNCKHGMATKMNCGWD